MKLKRIRMCDIKILYCDDWWDGPMSGICQYKGKYYRFGCTDETFDKKNKDGDPIMERTYTVWKLPFDRLIYEFMWHFDFITNVANNFNFDDRMKPSDLFKKTSGDFYKRRDKEYIELGKPPKLDKVGYFVE